MREIKFRAWDKKSKKMRVVSSIVFDSYSEFSKNIKVKLVNLWGKIFPAYDDGECNPDILVKREGSTFVLMQYTGLKDKNKVEIYEGDIVYCNNAYYEVVWEESKAVEFRLTIQSKKKYPKICDSYFGFNANNQVEVIGNIYEHKELLKN